MDCWKGFKADEETTMLLDSIKGFGVDTFNTILENAMRTMLIGGNFYAEIIRDEEGVLTNLKTFRLWSNVKYCRWCRSYKKI